MEWQFEAIDKLASDPALLSRQSQDKQRELSQIRRKSKQRARYIQEVGNLLDQNWVGDEPSLIGWDDHPVLDMSSDAEVSLRERDMKLRVPPGEACKDDKLMTHFYRWEDSTIYMMQVIREYNQDAEKWLANLGPTQAEKP